MLQKKSYKNTCKNSRHESDFNQSDQDKKWKTSDTDEKMPCYIFNFAWILFVLIGISHKKNHGQLTYKGGPEGQLS